MSHAIIQTDLGLPDRRQGKVRDLYTLPAAEGTSTPRLLIIATDRISAFDVVMPTPIPGKGRLLTEVSLRWFSFIEERGLVRTHVLSTDPEQLIGLGTPAISAADVDPLRGRIMIAQRCSVVPVECVARGYLDGSGWVEYQQSGSICGVKLPTGLRRGDRLPEPIFTPATKEEVGTHDENIDFERACAAAEAWRNAQEPALKMKLGSGRVIMERLREITLSIYDVAHRYGALRGLILADTKFEFGYAPISEGGDGSPILVDEALTPDSSRYWDASLWKPGGEQPSFDKQFLREYLNGLTAAGRWDKKAPGPALPDDVAAGTRARYEEVRRRLWEF